VRVPVFLAAFEYRNYRLLWAGAFLSSVGTWTQDVALNWLVHTRFLDPRYLGYKSFAAEAPLVALMLLGGAIADRADRRFILLASQVVQMAFATLLGFLFAAGRLGVTSILLIAFLTGLAQSQSAPTYQAVITTLVPAERIQSAVALNSLQFNLSRVLGPAVAGVLLAYAGAGWCFAVNAVSFLAVIAALWRIEIPSPAMRQESLVRSLGSGLRHVRESPVLLALTVTAAAGSFLAYPLVTYLPVLAGDVLASGAKGYGQLMSGFGLGAIAGALVTAQRGGGQGRGRRLLLAFVAYGALIVGVAFSRHQLLSVALLAAAGWSLVTAFSTLNSLVQENVPDALRGRVVGIYGLAFRGGMPLGSLLAGFLVASFGAPLTIGAFGALLALLAGVVLLRGRTLPDL
jgi:MFS family permease